LHLNRRQITGLIIVAVIVSIVASPQYRSITNVPHHLRLCPGQQMELSIDMPLQVEVNYDGADIIELSGKQTPQGWRLDLGEPISINPLTTGKTKLQVKLFGIIPLKQVVVEVLPEVRLMPGGHSIGVLLGKYGVLVVGDAAVRDGTRILHPAREVGLRKGDIILSVNSRPVYDDDDLVRYVDQAGRAGKAAVLEVHRDGQTITLTIKPVLCSQTKRYRIGLYVRDIAAGVGTMTFYDPLTRQYGALGHVITSASNSTPMSIPDGRIVKASVAGINQGKPGQPGEKIGTWRTPSDLIGNIESNTPFGIVGVLNDDIAPNPYFNEPIPVGLRDTVREGQAQIYTVLEGDRIEAFDIEIVDVNHNQDQAGPKSLKVKVTDPRLLQKSGGIVQGMSGSPIVQDGRLIGAITHVLINDPIHGYGVFIEWMLQNTTIIEGFGVETGRATQSKLAA